MLDMLLHYVMQSYGYNTEELIQRVKYFDSAAECVLACLLPPDCSTSRFSYPNYKVSTLLRCTRYWEMVATYFCRCVCFTDPVRSVFSSHVRPYVCVGILSVHKSNACYEHN